MPVVKLYAGLRKLAGRKEISITGATLAATLNELAHQNPPLGEAVLANHALRPHIVITLNGLHVADLNTSVSDQDVVAIFPPIAGG